MPQVNKQWSRMTQEERENALLAQAQQHRKNHPAGKGRPVENNDEPQSEDITPDRKNNKTEKDRRPGAGILTVAWSLIFFASTSNIGIFALAFFGLATYMAVRVLRAGRVGKIGKVFGWLLIGQVAWATAMVLLQAAPIISRLFAVLTLPAPVLG